MELPILKKRKKKNPTFSFQSNESVGSEAKLMSLPVELHWVQSISAGNREILLLVPRFEYYGAILVNG